MAHTAFWEDLLDLYQWGLGSIGSLHGSHACFHLQISNRFIETDDSFLIVAQVIQEAQVESARSNKCKVLPKDHYLSPRKVLVRATKQDFETVLRHATEVRVIQAFVQCRDDMVILDATAMPSFFAGNLAIRQDECLQVAEVFAGGYAGWHRAVSILQFAGVKAHMSWCLERDSDCVELLCANHPALHEVRSLHEVEFNRCPDDTLLIADNFNAAWWRPITMKRPVQLICFSPPCQPWSRAGRQAGLASEDGRLILQTVDFLKATGISVAVYEEVEHFPKHAHFGIYYNAMESAGYECAWRGLLQLAEVAPVSRPRYFLIWLHRDAKSTSKQIVASVWQALGFPSLRKMDVLFPFLPAALLDPCCLSQETLAAYLDPKYLTAGRFQRLPRTSVFEQRVVPSTKQAPCVMAAYHYQHELPKDLLLQRGLLGFLVQPDPPATQPRFMAAPEVASSHGACFAVKFHASDRVTMRILGNSLATQQSVMILALALQLTDVQCPAPDHCVSLCNSLRITASNSLLFELADGWMMCHQDYVGQLFSQHALKQQIAKFLSRGSHRFRLLQVASGHGLEAKRMQCQVSEHLDVSDVLTALGISGVEVLCGDRGWLVDSPHAVRNILEPGLTADVQVPHCLHVLVCDQHFFLHRVRPDVFVQLMQVFQQVPDHTAANVECYDLVGDRCHTLPSMPPVVFAVPRVQDVVQATPFGPASIIERCLALPHVAALTIEVPEDLAWDWWLSFPRHFVEALGYAVEQSCFPPPPGTVFMLNVHSTRSAPAVSSLELRQWLRILLFLAPIRHAAAVARSPSAPQGMRKVAVQVVARTIWQGDVPTCLTPDMFEQWWAAASGCVGLDPRARVFSGPFPLQADVALKAIPMTSGPGRFIRKQTGALLLSVMPALYGGGAKQDKKDSTQAKMAQLCLGHGMSLHEANRVTAQLLQQASQAQVVKALEGPDVVVQWAQLQELMQSAGVQLPDPHLVASRVTRKVSQQLRKKSLFQPQPCARDFALAGGYFANQDGSEATILRSLTPCSSGVILLDASVVAETIHDLAPHGPDELAILSLGHACPHPSTCQGKVQVPAHARGEDSHVLIAVCVHNLGERKVVTCAKAVDEVQVTDTVSCAFLAFSDEWPDRQSWQDLVSSPVKHILEQFRQEGTAISVMQPWGFLSCSRGVESISIMAGLLPQRTVILCSFRHIYPKIAWSRCCVFQDMSVPTWSHRTSKAICCRATRSFGLRPPRQKPNVSPFRCGNRSALSGRSRGMGSAFQKRLMQRCSKP